MDGVGLLARLLAEAEKGNTFFSYCGVEIFIKRARGVSFIYHEQEFTRTELTASDCINLLDNAYLSFTESWQAGLSARARQVLQRYSVFSIGELRKQLEQVSIAEWRARSNCGLRGYSEIKQHFENLLGSKL